MRSTNASISPAVRGRPGPRWPLPSCQSLGFHGQSTALIVIKPKPTWAELLAQNPVLLAQVIDDLVFPLVHPSGHGDQYETKRIQYSQHCRSLIIASLALAPNYRQFK